MLKKNLKVLFRLLPAAVLAVSLANSASAVPLLEEGFNYGEGNLTTVSLGAWVAHSGAGAVPVQVTSVSLTKAGLPSLGGKSAQYTNGLGSREDVNRTVSIPTTDGTSIYASCLFRVNTTSVSVSSDVVYHFFATTTLWPSRAYLKTDTSNSTFTLGVKSQGPSSPVFAPTSDPNADLQVGTTYLVVLGLDFVSGPTNNVASIWINPTLGQATPPAPLISNTETAATEPLPVAIAFRQGANIPGTNMDIDDIRVGTWADVTPAAAAVNEWMLF